ncbi:MAG TPA: DnaD domain protein [Anaerolineales bacterium]|nr:DnaD domain protein [Anaerolineales bacterium]
MKTFKGFTDSETFTQLPNAFFHQLIHQIDDIAELKVTLFVMWHVDHMDGPFRALSKMDFDVKELGLGADEITRGLEKAVRRGSLLTVNAPRDAMVYFLLNSPRGRSAIQAIEKGKWNPADGVSAPILERPNIFKLYEENIGPLTPLIADALKDAEQTYADEWIAEAIELAVKNNKRYWKYCEAILKRWKEEGRHGKKDQQDSVQSSERYTKSEFAEYLESE